MGTVLNKALPSQATMGKLYTGLCWSSRSLRLKLVCPGFCAYSFFACMNLKCHRSHPSTVKDSHLSIYAKPQVDSLVCQRAACVCAVCMFSSVLYKDRLLQFSLSRTVDFCHPRQFSRDDTDTNTKHVHTDTLSAHLASAGSIAPCVRMSSFYPPLPFFFFLLPHFMALYFVLFYVLPFTAYEN